MCFCKALIYNKLVYFLHGVETNKQKSIIMAGKGNPNWKKGVDNGVGQRFQKGNKFGKGRKKKKFSEHTDELKALGYDCPSREEYYEMLGLMMSMTEDDMERVLNDKERPQWIRWLVEDLRKPKYRPNLMADYRDWMFGRAKQQVDKNVSGTVTVLNLGGGKPMETIEAEVVPEESTLSLGEGTENALDKLENTIKKPIKVKK